MLLTVSSSRGDDETAILPALRGAVAGSNGKPIADVRVDVSAAAPKVGRGIFCPSCYLDCGKWATTDDHGRFTISDVDPSLKFRLVLTKPGRQTLQTELVDPADGPLSLSLEELPVEIDSARVVSGVVTQTGSPVAGALVQPHGAKRPGRRWWGRVEGVDPTVTDASGRFSMILPEDFLAVDIQVTGYGFCGELMSLLEPGGEPVEIEVRAGANVVGKLVKAGKPAPGMSIAVVQLDRGTNDGIFIAAVGDVTDEEGSFEFRYLPPNQRYCIYSIAGEAKRSDSPYILTTKTFSVPANGETRDLGSLDVARPYAIRGVVRRLDGQPLPANLKLSLGRDPAWDLIGIPVHEDGTFEATGLPPETYEIRLGNRDLVIVAKQMPYQMLSDASFGLRLSNSIDNLLVTIEAKE